MRLDERRRQLAYEAALILRAAGWGFKRVARALRGLGFDVSPWTVRGWLLGGRAPRARPSPLLRALFYHRAYELAVELKGRHPDWGYKRVAAEVRRVLGVRVPPATVYYWLKRGTRPNVAPLRLLPELGYVIGAVMTDCARGDYVRLEVRDRDFAEQFAKALTRLTGREYDVGEDEDGYYAVKVGGSALRCIVKSGLWKAVALAWPREFLQGLFDGDGGVGVAVGRRPEFRVVVTLDNSDLELLSFARHLLGELGIECSWPPRRKDRRGEVVRICGRGCVLKKDCWEVCIWRREGVERFAALINFRVGRKRGKLEDAIRILRRYERNRDRVREWLEKYEKRNGRWLP
ncbi:MAG: hypothetical protein DRJ56_05625, partial [Thermoprotei archaeon]